MHRQTIITFYTHYHILHHLIKYKGTTCQKTFVIFLKIFFLFIFSYLMSLIEAIKNSKRKSSLVRKELMLRIEGY